MYEAPQKKKPYLPTSRIINSFPPIPCHHKIRENKDVVKIRDILDAETGEKLSPTLARWSAQEGRLNLDSHTIIAMGTGKLDISSIKKSSREYDESPKNSLVLEFLESGPLNIMFHNDWNPKTNTVKIKSLHKVQDSKLSPIKYDYQPNTTIINIDSSRPVEQRAVPFTPILTRPRVSTSSASRLLMEAERWTALEDRTFSELFELAAQMETNKTMTLEKKTRNGMEGVRANCRAMA
jgi:hypothetical protein